MFLIYVMSFFQITSKEAPSLESLLKKFLWEGAKEDKNISLIHWEMTDLPKVVGGVI